LKTILVPGGDDRVRAFVEEAAPVPVHVVDDPSVSLGANDLVLLVVEVVDAALRAAVVRVLTAQIPYVVLIRRDVWSVGDRAVHELLDEVQRDPRRKLIRFWRDRGDLEQTIRDEVFALDSVAFVSAAVRDGTFVKVGSTVEQSWEVENAGFVVWEDRTLKEIGREGLVPAVEAVPLPRTEPGQRVRMAVSFTAPAEPGSYRSVWKMVRADGSVCFPWTTGVWCQVLAVL